MGSTLEELRQVRIQNLLVSDKGGMHCRRRRQYGLLSWFSTHCRKIQGAGCPLYPPYTPRQAQLKALADATHQRATGRKAGL